MIYRGFKIERVIRMTGSDQPGDEVVSHRNARPRVEHIVSETIASYHWQEIGSTNNLASAIEMIDRIADVRDALYRVVHLDLSHDTASLDPSNQC